MSEEKATKKPLSKSELRKRRMTQYYRSSHYVYTCGKCGEEKFGSDFYFDVRYTNGRSLNRCKECVRQAARARRRRDRKRLLKLREQRRKEYDAMALVEFQCPDCKLVKPGKDFPYSESSRSGISLTRCRQCQNKLNSDKRKAINRELRKIYADGRSKGMRDKRKRDKAKREAARQEREANTDQPAEGNRDDPGVSSGA